MSRWIFFASSSAVLTMLLAVPHGRAQETATWGYDGEGAPEFWASLNDGYAKCGEGQAQSPIDLDGREALERYVGTLDFHYNDSVLTVADTGHNIEIRYDEGSWIGVNGKAFDLVQFHFHSPSEHTFSNGAQFPMELHLVHRGATGQLAVVGIFIRAGAENEALQSIWEHLPAEVGEQEFRDIEINAAELLPDDKRAYHYIGSLTTPPCSENVRWFVMRQPIELSAAQIAQFKTALAGICCDHNNRPTQSLNGRSYGLDIF